MWCVYCMLLNAVNERVIKLYVKEFFNSRSCRELAFECLFYSVALYIFNFLCAWCVCVFLCMSMDTRISEDTPRCRGPCLQPLRQGVLFTISHANLAGPRASRESLVHTSHLTIGQSLQILLLNPLFCGSQGSELRSQHLCSHRFTHSSISPALSFAFCPHSRQLRNSSYLFKTRFSYSPSQYFPGKGSPAPLPS